jgi:hypothetical protein
MLGRADLRRVRAHRLQLARKAAAGRGRLGVEPAARARRERGVGARRGDERVERCALGVRPVRVRAPDEIGDRGVCAGDVRARV